MIVQSPKIVIIGAGFAGLRAATSLSRAKVSIVLVDRNNYHTFVPLLYQVATCFIPPETVTYPLRKYLRFNNNLDFVQAEVLEINFDAKIVNTDQRSINYDYLVIATGSQTKFLGVDGALEYTYPLRTLDDAMILRNRILGNFENALGCTSLHRRKQLLTFTIVGGGATGVELAGALMELIQGSLSKDYCQIDLNEVRVILIHSGNRLLTNLPCHLGEYTFQQLSRLGVKIFLNTRVNSVMPGAVELNKSTILETETVIWTAGVEGVLPVRSDQLTTIKNKQVCVRSTLQLLEYPEVYAIGDVASVTHGRQPLIGIAPEALQQGTTVAKNLKRQLRGLSPKPFNYFNKGTAAIISRNAGVAYLFGKIPLKGWSAWLLWLCIHLFYLPGLSNRLNVLGSWIRDYITKERNIRQIFTILHYSKRV